MTRASTALPLQFATLDDVVDALRDSGRRLTVPCRMILEELFAASAPPSAEQLAETLDLQMTSVYRNLERLEDLGAVSHVHLGHGPGRYALVGRGVREYLVCQRCDAVTEVEPEAVDPVREVIRATFGFEAQFTHFPILGLCAECSAQSDATPNVAPRGRRDGHRHTH